MIRLGKSPETPWLTLPVESFMPWAELNGVSFNGTHVSGSAQPSGDPQNAPAHTVDNANATAIKGFGLAANKYLDSATNKPVLTVPLDMVLSEARVRQLASGDVRLAELLKSCESLTIVSLLFAMANVDIIVAGSVSHLGILSPRVSILIFLLYQITVANPNVTTKIGTHTPFIEYCKFMPIPRVSTLFTEDELQLFEGTTLVPATRAKLKKLTSEYTALRNRTKSTPWLAPVWWGAVEKPRSRAEQSLIDAGFRMPPAEIKDGPPPLVSLEDWILLDAMYRSRALEWPGQGEAMVPVLDMANHNVPANATFDVMSTNEGILQLEKDIQLKSGDEIFISYGDSKSPLEILFSYGFLPDYTESAGVILLPLPPLDSNDPLAPPKAATMSKENCAPGIKVSETAGGISWDSDVLWLLIANEEDGLEFKVVYGTGLRRELAMFWRDKEVSIRGLKEVLEKDKLFDLLKLRASVIVLQQVDRQLRELEETSLDFEAAMTGAYDESLLQAAKKLREMEGNLLVSARQSVEEQKAMLILSPVVQQYFEALHTEEPSEEVPDNDTQDDFT